MARKAKRIRDSNGKVALVTGGAVRVGRALSLGLAEEGFDLVVHYHSSGADARAVEAEIHKLGRRCVTVAADVADPEQVGALVDAVRTEFGRLDLLVNSASIFKANDLLDVDAREWDEVMGVNLKGPFLTARAASGLLTEAGGCIINIVDVSALQPWVKYPHHSVSKAGLLQLTRVMARVLAPRGPGERDRPGNRPSAGGRDGRGERTRASENAGGAPGLARGRPTHGRVLGALELHHRRGRHRRRRDASEPVGPDHPTGTYPTATSASTS